MIPVRIQHRPGSRNEALHRLLERLPAGAEIISDTGPDPANPWRGYQLCLTDLPDSSHVVVLQDDSVPCVNFAEACSRIAQANPDTPVCLFVSGTPAAIKQPMMRAILKDRRYVQFITGFVPVVAMLWPTHVARSFMEWAVTYNDPGGRAHMSDDAAVGVWMHDTKQRVLATCPSLVEHPDDVVSTIGRKHHNGADRGRVALHFIGDADPLGLDWSWR